MIFILFLLLITLLIAAFKANNALGKRIGYRTAALIFQPIIIPLLLVTGFVLLVIVGTLTAN